MKLIKSSLFLFFSAIATLGFAQKGASVISGGGSFSTLSASLNNENGTNMVSFVAAFEQGITRKFALGVSYDYGKKKYENAADQFGIANTGTLSISSFTFNGKLYFKEATKGFYLGLGAGVAFETSDYTLITSLSRSQAVVYDSRYNIALKTGYQLNISSNATLQGDVSLETMPQFVDRVSRGSSGGRTRFSLQFGYRF